MEENDGKEDGRYITTITNNNKYETENGNLKENGGVWETNVLCIHVCKET